LKVAEQFPVKQTIATRAGTPLIVASASVIFAVAGIAVPMWSYGTRYLWAGGRYQSEAGTEHSGQARRSGSDAVAMCAAGADAGLRPARRLCSRYGDKDQWQRVRPVPMKVLPYLFSVREALKYYVATADVRNPNYNINIMDLPNINNLKLTYTFPKWTGRKPQVKSRAAISMP
jgi:hypothetical protein